MHVNYHVTISEMCEFAPINFSNAENLPVTKSIQYPRHQVLQATSYGNAILSSNGNFRRQGALIMPNDPLTFARSFLRR